MRVSGDYYALPYARLLDRKIFAIEAENLAAILNRYWNGGDNEQDNGKLRPLDLELRERTRGEGAFLPDGLALVPWDRRVRARRVSWDPLFGRFTTN